MENRLADIISASLQQGKLPHALLIETLDLAKTQSELPDLVAMLLCEAPDYSASKGCGHCKQCQLLMAGNHPDFLSIEPTTNSIGIDEIRAVSNKFTTTAQLAQAQVVVIQNAELMTENAANALLKTLEEPNAKCYLVLVSVGYVKLMPTIISRCQQIRQPVLSKDALKQKYPNLPDYLVGFADQNESLLVKMAEPDELNEYVRVYQSFITWLKGQESSATLLSNIASKDELIEFWVYLVSRRIRQVLMKGYLQPAEQAQALIHEFNFTRRQVKGHNKALALTSLVHQLEGLIR